MRANSGFRDRLFGSGLVVALTVLLAVASVLAAFGLFLELSGLRTVVVTQQSPTLIASHVQADPLESETAADDEAGAENDPAADPSGVHDEAPDLHAHDEEATPEAGRERAGGGRPGVAGRWCAET